jgi:hypothetical protein
MVRKRAKKPAKETFLETYKRIRKPMPPPERVSPDSRRNHQEEQAQREIEEGKGEGPRSPGGT